MHKPEQHLLVADAPDLKRRAVVSASLAAFAMTGLGLSAGAAQAQGAAAEAASASSATAATATPVVADGLAAFTRLSEFATGRKLDAILAGRYYAALKKRDDKLDAAVASALGSVQQTQASDIDAFLGNTDEATHATLLKVVSAWYLGIVGDGKDVELIAYAEALMYEPARGILVVPSYGGGPNSWGEKPV